MALFAKDNGKRPQGHKEAFEKARDEFRNAHPQASKPRSGSRDSNKGNKGKDKNRKSMKSMLDADDHDSDDSDCCEAPRAPLGCLRTTVFTMRVVGEDDDEPKIDTAAEIADTLGGWATVKRSRRPMKPKNPNANKSVTLVNEHELAQ